ncbi:hypothetical protein BH23CHL3_BH23CHL3_11880 [soil metagenome]
MTKSGSDITPEEALRYALGLSASVVISGMDSLEILRKNLAVADEFQPMTDDEIAALLERSRPFAPQGTFEPFKTTHAYDGAEGRKVRDYPLDAAS